MKQKLKKLCAFALAMALLLSIFAGCAEKSTPEQTEEPDVVPEEVTDTVPEETPAEPEEDPAEEAPAEEVPVEEEPMEEEPAKPQFLEALEVLYFIGAIDARTRLGAVEPLTGAQAEKMAISFGLESSGIDTSSETVSGSDFLVLALRTLGYNPETEGYLAEGNEALLAQAEELHLTRGIFRFDPNTDITVEQAAQILLSVLQCYKVEYSGADTVQLGDKKEIDFGISHVAIPDFPDGFNRPGSKWVDAATGTDISSSYVATPVFEYGEAISWCDLLEALGYPKDDLDRNYMKDFQNTADGGEYSVRYDKCHWGNGTDGHSGCANDHTSGTGFHLEVYQIGDTEYRNIYKSIFLGQVTNEGLTLYGFNGEVWGPWAMEGLPVNGYYYVNYFWNAYEQGEGPIIVRPAETIRGTLDSCNEYYTVVSGEKRASAPVFSLGYDIASNRANFGKEYTFFVTQWGHIIGCIEDVIE